MIRIRKEKDINIVNIQGYDAIYLLTILDLTETKENLLEEDLEKLSSLRVRHLMGYKYASLDFELDDRNFLYIMITTLEEKRALYTSANLFKMSLQKCNRLLTKTRKELLSYNQFALDTETQRKVAELNYFINTIYYVSYGNKLIRNSERNKTDDDSLKRLENIGVTPSERELIFRSTA